MAILEKNFGINQYTSIFGVDEEDHNLRVDQFALNQFDTFSRQQIKAKIKLKEIEIIGWPHLLRPSTRVKEGMRVQVTFNRTSHEDEYWAGEKVQLKEVPDTLFEDEEVLAISKPAFMATHPTGKHLFYCATTVMEHQTGIFLRAVHRLDRETSGVLLLGKTLDGTKKYSTDFENDLVRKCYFFMAKIDPKKFKGETQFKANERMGTHEEGLKRVYIHTYPYESEMGKSAETKFQILFENQGYVLGLAFPITGRQHQIRVHAKAHGLPLIGDKLYLGNYPLFQRFKDQLATPEDHQLMQLPRHALHSIALNIPYGKKRKVISSNIPEDFIPWIRDHFSESIEEVQERVNSKMNDYFQESFK